MMKERAAQAFSEWLKSKGVTYHCPMCYFSKWQAGDLVNPRPMDNTGIQHVASSVPLLEIICERCSHVIFFDAKEIGIAS